MPPPIFPLTPPSASFFTINGLAAQLQQEPYVEYVPYMISTLQAVSSPFNLLDYIDTPTGNMFSSYQLQTYNQQLAQFRTVYSYNQAAYSTAQATGTAPRYFTFVTYKDQSNYRTAVGLINRLYNPNLMAYMFAIPWPPYSLCLDMG